MKVIHCSIKWLRSDEELIDNRTIINLAKLYGLEKHIEYRRTRDNMLIVVVVCGWWQIFKLGGEKVTLTKVKAFEHDVRVLCDELAEFESNVGSSSMY